MRDDERLSAIPVIVTTGRTDAGPEGKALKLGAKDYIFKPYNAAIIKQRILNTIILRETATTVNALQRDRLTGLYSRDAFLDRIHEFVPAQEPGSYIIACFDIEKFKVINDQYGTKKVTTYCVMWQLSSKTVLSRMAVSAAELRQMTLLFSTPPPCRNQKN